jgi:Rod binding domain-containing protein
MDGAQLPVDVGALRTANSITRAQHLARQAGGDQAGDVGKEFEALFATMLVKELRKALPEQGFFGDAQGSDVFNGWMDQFLGQQLAADGALDLAGRVRVAMAEKAAGEEG